MALQKEVTSIDASKQMVYVRQGLHTIGVILDPWPSTEAEQKSQALQNCVDLPEDETLITQGRNNQTSESL